MFRKIISNLSFSPALVWQLGYYAKSIRKEEIKRRLGLIFIILALIVQSLMIFQPAEPANASNLNDMVNGGIGSSIDNFLSPYDSNTKHLKDIANYIGITREEITSTKLGSWNSDNKISWGILEYFTYAQGERQHIIKDSFDQQIVSIYSRPSKLFNNKSTTGWFGVSSKIGWFGIEQNSGNIVTERLPISVLQKCLTKDVSCEPCPNNDLLPLKDSSCTPNLVKSISATNISQGFLDASSINAVPSDQISYTISVENTGKTPINLDLTNNLSDILEYSTLIDNGGGSTDNGANVISWSNITLEPNSKQTRTFVIKLLDEIPATAQGISNPESFDCKITDTFGNSINIQINCPIQKDLEKIIMQSPKIDPFNNFIFSATVLLLASFLSARAHLIKKEIRSIRKNISTGTI